MRAFAMAVVLLVAACGEPDSGTTPLSSPVAVATTCTLPVYWADTATNSTLAAFVRLPSGTVSMSGIIRPTNQFLFGTTYDRKSNTWLPAPEPYLSPDHKQYAYEVLGTSANEIHVVDIASGADRVAYHGTLAYSVTAFETDGIYMRQAINAKQGAYQKLFRLDPAGGTPKLVRGSDHHMYPTGWTVVNDSAAWGLDYQSKGKSYTYVVERLDLTTGAVTTWFTSDPDHQFAPMGTDGKNRLYITDGFEVWRLAKPGQVEHLLSPPKTEGSYTFGGEMLSDAHGAWFQALGGVWFHSDTEGSRQLTVNVPEEMVSPAGPCL